MKQLKAVAPFFPAGDQGLKLEPHLYEMALFELLKTDPEAFLETVRAWKPELYSVSAVVKALVEQLLIHPDEEDLQRALATLFTYQVVFHFEVIVKYILHLTTFQRRKHFLNPTHMRYYNNINK